VPVEARSILRLTLVLCTQVWDIGGQSASSKMLGLYIHRASCIFLCYDVTNRESFHSVEDWLLAVKGGLAAANKERTNEELDDEPPPVPLYYLTGNKIDIHGKREVPEKQHEDFIQQQDLAGGAFSPTHSR